MKLEGNIDELIFDYLEGNLAKEEQEAFDVIKDENETFAHHVRLWQNAYVNETLPSTSDLEERCLVRSQPRTSIVTKAGFISFVVGVMLFVPSSVTELRVKTTPPDLELQPNTATVEPSPVVIMKVAYQEEEVIDQPLRLQPGLNETSSELRINDLWVSVPVVLQSDRVKPNELSILKRNRPTFSDRDSERMKRRQLQLQRRRAAEFKAGNIPYVVPLSTKNF